MDKNAGKIFEGALCAEGIKIGIVCARFNNFFVSHLLTGAIANTLLFLFVSVPLADEHQARKPGFEEYKAETHMLWPF